MGTTESATPSAQEEQQRLIEQAMADRRVAEAVAAYNLARPDVPLPTLSTEAPPTYGTGGND
jgi:hypothetical protein